MKNINNCVKVSLFLSFLLLLISCSTPTSESTTKSYVASEYFVTTPGNTFTYAVSDSGYNGASDEEFIAELTFQNYKSGLPNQIDFFATFNSMTENTFSAIGGKESEGYYFFYAGYPSRNLGNFLFNIIIPSSYSLNTQYQIGDNRMEFENIPDIFIEGIRYSDCVRMIISNTSDNNYLNCVGYIDFSRYVGMIRAHFKRNYDQSVVKFSLYSIDTKFEKTISGKVFNASIPQQDYIVQIGNANWGTRSVSDQEGSYHINCYGDNVVILVGKDINSDNIFDINAGDKIYTFKVSDEVNLDIIKNLELSLADQIEEF